MDILILVFIFVSLALGVYRLKKHSNKVRKEMIEELDLLEDLNSPANFDWEDQDADVQPEYFKDINLEPKPTVIHPEPIVDQPKPKKRKGRPRKKQNGKA
jgi:hypothetical protein